MILINESKWSLERLNNRPICLIGISILIFALSVNLYSQPLRQKSENLQRHFKLERFGPGPTVVRVRNEKRIKEKVYFSLETPSPAKRETHSSLRSILDDWLRDYPNSSVIEILRDPPFKSEGGFQEAWVWVTHGKANLNVRLVREGICRAEMMILDEKYLPYLLVDRDDYNRFVESVSDAENLARAESKGIWQKDH